MRDRSVIVHIAFDDKFIDMAYAEFEEVAPNRNRVLLLGRQRPLQYIRRTPTRYVSLGEALDYLRQPDVGVVIFHSLPDAFLPLLQRMPFGPTVVWLGWGYDYYDRLLAQAFPRGLLLHNTQALRDMQPPSKAGSGALAAIKSRAAQWIGRRTHWSPRLLERVDIFSPVIEAEFNLALRLNPGFEARYVDWNYGNCETDLGDAQSFPTTNGRDVLVGNSATFESNHADAFELIERHVDLADCNVFVPLSYGDPWYRDAVIREGNARFGGRFVPITDFMAPDAYRELVRSCGFVFMNHLRQQALGNICIAMLAGSRVYMNRSSPLYRWLIEKGASIDDIDALASTSGHRSRLTQLAPAQQEKNAAVVTGHWGRERKLQKTRHLLDMAMSRTGQSGADV